MARRRKRKLTKEKKRLRRHKSAANRQRDLVQDTTAVFTCAAQTAGDFSYQCSHGHQELETNLVYNRLAIELWHDRPGRAQELVAALEDLLTERQRHLQALHLIGKRLDNLAEDETFHLHLDPPDDYRELVRSRLFPSPPPK